MRFLIGLYSMLMTTAALAQSVQGRVIDGTTQAPIAFVNLRLIGSRQGTTTDIDGRFSLSPKEQEGILLISFVGYATRQVPFSAATARLRIELTPTTASLNEVVVRPGPNPAHAIIDRVLANRAVNNPLNRPQFRYNAYTKLLVTPARGFALRSDYAEKDSSTVTYFDTTRTVKTPPHLFMSESYSERLFKAPGKSQETVLANRVSGMTNPLFSVLGTQFQPFGFYANTLRVLDKDYLNPISPGYARTYDFDLVDTLLRETDSLYVIRFRPRPGRNFDGLAGVMQISSDGYAIQTIVAQSLDTSQPFAFRLQQQYRQLAGRWFPDQLHTDLYYQGDRLQRTDPSTKKTRTAHFLMAIRTYLSNVDLEKPLVNSQFTYQSLRLMPSMNQTPPSGWDSLRTAPLTIRETKTYAMYDSLRRTPLGRAINSLPAIIEALVLGRFPVGKVDLLTNRLLRFNNYESVRLGVGAQTNRRLLSWLQLDGYVGYGFRDGALKYGAGVQLNLVDRLALTLRGSYQQEVVEPGQPDLPTGGNAFSSSQIRAYFSTRADSVQRTRLELALRPSRKLYLTVAGQTEWRNPTYAYRFMPATDRVSPRPDSTFRTTELSVGLRWAWHEQLTRIRDQDVLTERSWPVLSLRLTKGLRGVMGSAFSYTKLEASFDHSFPIRRLGRSSFLLVGGQLWGDALPYPYLFAGRGILATDRRSTENRLVYVPGYFQTASLYEFTNDRYVSLFYQHNLGRLLFRTQSKFSQPEIAILGNAGWGTLQHPAYHQEVVTQSMEKGLFEAGVLVKRLLILHWRTSEYTLGVGATRRLGAYQWADDSKNWAFNLTFFNLF